MSDDLLARIDALTATCPCGAPTRPDDRYCSEDCVPVPGAGALMYPFAALFEFIEEAIGLEIHAWQREVLLAELIDLRNRRPFYDRRQ